jgi:hypothetical protein
MSKGLAVTFLVGLVIVGLAVWGLFYKQRGAHIDPKGSVLKVRTMALDEKSSAAVLDIRIANDSDYPVVARTIEIKAVTDKGESQGSGIAAGDLADLIKNYPVLGEQFNPVLKMRDQVPPHSSIDREVGAQFDIPILELDGRKELVVSVEDIRGPVAEMHEKRK